MLSPQSQLPTQHGQGVGRGPHGWPMALTEDRLRPSQPLPEATPEMGLVKGQRCGSGCREGPKEAGGPSTDMGEKGPSSIPGSALLWAMWSM